MTPHDSDLDQQLRALFAAPDLDVAPRPGAAKIVLARVTRIRRRRRAAQATGVLVLAALLSFAVLNTSVISNRAASTTPATHPTVTASGYTELAMSGSAVGSLRLGMTLAQAKATGLLDLSSADANTPHAGCTQYAGEHGIVSVSLDHDVVTAIGVYEFIHNAEGLAIGATYAQLHATYPQSVPATPDRKATTYRVPLPAQPGAWYVFALDVGADTGHPKPPSQTSRIMQLSLANSDRRCG